MGAEGRFAVPKRRNDFEYISGGHGSGFGWRVYKSLDGLVGKVVRTGRGRHHGEWEGVTTRYFIWDFPDSAPEYDTYEDACAVLILIEPPDA